MLHAGARLSIILNWFSYCGIRMDYRVRSSILSGSFWLPITIRTTLAPLHHIISTTNYTFCKWFVAHKSNQFDRINETAQYCLIILVITLNICSVIQLTKPPRSFINILLIVFFFVKNSRIDFGV